MDTLDAGNVGQGVESHAQAYAAAVVDCVHVLAGAVETYRADGTVGGALSAVDEAESACDRRRRELVRTLASMPVDAAATPPGEVVTFVETLDCVPNRAERAVVTLDSTAPPLDGVTELDELVALTCEAAEALSAATVTYADGLYGATDGRAQSVAAATRRVVEAESRCDDIRRTAVREAFAGDTAEALLVREAVLTLESVSDAAEDAADALRYLQVLSSGVR